MTAAMTCLAPFQGLATCLDTLCAQAYGEGRKHLVGLQVQRNVLFLCSAAIPIAVLWMFSEPILVRMVDAETARLSASYLKVMIFSIPAFAIFESGKRMLQAQGLFRETSYIILVVAPINIVLNWFLVWKMELGFIGAPIGVVISRNLLAILMVLYIKFINGYQCWGGLDRRAFSNWGIMVRLALPGMTMVVAEWLAFELMTLLSSRFGTDYLAGQSAIMTLVALLYQIPFSMSVAGSTRVASLVGGGVIDSAKLAAEIVRDNTSGVFASPVMLTAPSLPSHRFSLAFSTWCFVSRCDGASRCSSPKTRVLLLSLQRRCPLWPLLSSGTASAPVPTVFSEVSASSRSADLSISCPIM